METLASYLDRTANRVHPDPRFGTDYGRAPITRDIVITDLAADLRNAGWTDGDYRTRGALAVCEFSRNGQRAWVLVDMTNNRVIDASRRIRAFVDSLFRTEAR